MYMFYEVVRTEEQPSSLREKLSKLLRSEYFDKSLTDHTAHLDPNVVVFMIEIITSLRWDDSIGPPLHKVSIDRLFHSSILLTQFRFFS